MIKVFLPVSEFSGSLDYLVLACSLCDVQILISTLNKIRYIPAEVFRYTGADCHMDIAVEALLAY